jgi:hypothetical protein
MGRLYRYKLENYEVILVAVRADVPAGIETARFQRPPTP